MQAAQAQRSNTYPFDAVGSGQVQPGHSTAAGCIRSLSDQQTDLTLEPPRGERHHVLTELIEPLQIVNGDQDGGVRGEAVERRRERRRHDTS